jgi:hypothetical protein
VQTAATMWITTPNRCGLLRTRISQSNNQLNKIPTGFQNLSGFYFCRDFTFVRILLLSGFYFCQDFTFVRILLSKKSVIPDYLPVSSSATKHFAFFRANGGYDVDYHTKPMWFATNED